MAVGEEKSDTGWMHDTLLHRKSLLVVAASDLEDVTFEFVADAVTCNLCAHSDGFVSGCFLPINVNFRTRAMTRTSCP